ncbi:hypothetical protein [Pseudofrankia sp. BMG5.37]|uniref:hypothetical protein n=1 Tax=Pseudofrankia sp. BMG5.37 TaxID=3050035 RepID=UPI002893F003|nr:hypothetical protein [Pseudofrankia sp. BMG5.37]MDT3438354.1 hypothetical protein [Pseudofrankia sp. BMG5.37]
MTAEPATAPWSGPRSPAWWACPTCLVEAVPDRLGALAIRHAAACPASPATRARVREVLAVDRAAWQAEAGIRAVGR